MRKFACLVGLLLLVGCSNNAKVNIKVTPENSVVYVDGQQQTVFPLVISKNKKYVIKVDPYDDNYKPFEASYEITKDRDIIINLKRKTAAEVQAEEKQRKYQAYLQQQQEKQAAREAELNALRERCSQVQFVVENWSWSNEYDQAYKVEGLITNVSGSPQEYVKVEIRGYDAAANFISSNYSYLDYNPVLDDQSSPFDIYLNYNPVIERASIQVILDSQPVTSMDRDDYDKECAGV